MEIIVLMSWSIWMAKNDLIFRKCPCWSFEIALLSRILLGSTQKKKRILLGCPTGLSNQVPSNVSMM